MAKFPQIITDQIDNNIVDINFAVQNLLKYNHMSDLSRVSLGAFCAKPAPISLQVSDKFSSSVMRQRKRGLIALSTFYLELIHIYMTSVEHRRMSYRNREPSTPPPPPRAAPYKAYQLWTPSTTMTFAYCATYGRINMTCDNNSDHVLGHLQEDRHTKAPH